MLDRASLIILYIKQMHRVKRFAKAYTQAKTSFSKAMSLESKNVLEIECSILDALHKEIGRIS